MVPIARIERPPLFRLTFEGELDGVPLRVSNEGLLFPFPQHHTYSPKGSSQTILHCAHWTLLILPNVPSKLASLSSLGRAPMLV